MSLGRTQVISIVFFVSRPRTAWYSFRFAFETKKSVLRKGLGDNLI